MDKEHLKNRWQRIKELFRAAMAKKPEEQSAFLDMECGDDTELRAEVEELIQADSSAGDFLKRS